MALISLAPPPGICSDDTTFATQGRWADGNNVRFVGGTPQVVGGETSTGASSLSYPIRNMLAFDAAGSTYLAYGTVRALWTGAGLGSPTSRLSFGSDIVAWSLAAYGDTLMAAPKGQTLYQWAGGATATPIAAAPDNITAMLVTPQRQVLALGCNEEVSTTFNGMCIRGSDLENPSDWTTSAANNAFEHILEGAGNIVTGRLIGDYVAIWTDSALWLGQFIGNPGQTYRFEPIDEGNGCIAPNGVTVMDGVAYWLGTDLQLRAWSPGTTPQVIPCPIWNDFNNDYARGSTKTFVGSISRFGEVWILYDGGQDFGSENSRYIAYSVRESVAAQRPVWFKGDMARACILDSGPLAAIGNMQAAGSGTLMGDNSGGVIVAENGQDTSRTWFLQSADQYVDNARRRMLLRGVIPDFEYQLGNISLTLFCRDRPQSSPVTKGPYVLAVEATKKDFRASGKIIAIRFSSGSIARFGKPLFDTIATGQR